MKKYHEQYRKSLFEKRYYALVALPGHLANADLSERLHKLLTTFTFIQKKIDLLGTESVIDDYALAQQRDLVLIEQALRLSALALNEDSSLLSGQLLGRLMTERSSAIKRLLADAIHQAKLPWIKPLTQGLISPRGRLIRTLEGHESTIADLKITNNGNFIISAAGDEGSPGAISNIDLILGRPRFDIRKWDLESGKQVLIFEGHKGPIRSIALTTDDKHVISASDDATIKIWDIDKGTEIASLEDHTACVTALGLTPNNRYLISCAGKNTWLDYEIGRYEIDNTIKCWDLRDYKVVWSVDGHSSQENSIAISSDGIYIISAAGDKFRSDESELLKLRIIRNGLELPRFPRQSSCVNTIVCVPNSNRIIAGYEDGSMIIWDIESGSKKLHIIGHNLGILSIAVTSDGARAVSASKDNSLKIWDLSDGSNISTLHGHLAAVYSVSITPDDKQIVSGSADNTIKIWRLYDE